MNQKETIKLSVRELVEFVLQSGDIQSGFRAGSRLVDGIRGHQAVQQSSTEEYTPEVPISYVMETPDFILEIGGRIDGVIHSGGMVTIEEIKTTGIDLDMIGEDHNPLHWAQAKCYAFLYAIQEGMDSIRVRLTYYHLEKKECRSFLRSFRIQELADFFHNLTKQYIEWTSLLYQWMAERNRSIRSLVFPFPQYRKGQRELAAAVYRTVRDGKKLFVQAPTGTGKTIATLFPAIKAMGEGLSSKIFYLTAKTITRTVAEKALDHMRQQGLRMKSLTITAKEKICFMPEMSCDPLNCKYAKGYYDRIRDGIKDIFTLDSFTRPVIEEYAMKHCLCPFEFSLDLALWCDCIICDYNYAFDPRVYLKRFFMEKGGAYTFLIDEAHNLADRAREMFSAELTKKPVLQLKRAFREIFPPLYRIFNDINAWMIKIRKLCEENREGIHVQKEAPKELYPLLQEFLDTADEWLSQNAPSKFREDLLTLYFDAYAFLRTSESYDERYATYFEKSGSDVKIKLFCLDPSYLLREAMKRGKAAILFSATLIPLNYFVEILGGDDSSQKLRLPSPFPRENLCLLLDARISTRYKMREHTYDEVTRMIYTVVSEKTGNYLVYFPSYQYMNEVCTRFQEQQTEAKVIIQQTGMSEEERESFLDQFSCPGQRSMVAFAVMGGVFGEGIDLTGDRLSGAIIVGVGLPQLCLERNIIRRYFDQTKGLGFEYAYVYPGMNKVLQAAGRVIRTEADRGVVLLIDDRFDTPLYRNLYPAEWNPISRITGPRSLSSALRSFWGEGNRQ